MYYLVCTSTFLDSGGSKVLILFWQNCDDSPSHQLAMGAGLRTLRAKAQAQQILQPKAATGFINRQFCFLLFYRCNIMYMLLGILFVLFSRPIYSFHISLKYFFGSSLFIQKSFYTQPITLARRFHFLLHLTQQLQCHVIIRYCFFS